MKLSELIRELEKKLAEHGDVDVVVTRNGARVEDRGAQSITVDFDDEDGAAVFIDTIED